MKTNKNKFLFIGILAFCLFSIQLINSQTSSFNPDGIFDDEIRIQSQGKHKDWRLQSYSGGLLFLDDNVRMVIKENGKVGIGEDKPQEKLHVNGTIKATNLKLTNPITFLEVEVPTGSYTAIRGSNGGEQISKIHFFDDTWKTKDLNRSSGSINIDGIKGVTLGDWGNPILIVDKDAKTIYGDKLLIGSTQPKDMVSNTSLTVDGRVYISENGGTETGFNSTKSRNYKDYLLWVEEGIVSKDIAIADVEKWPDYVFNKDYKLPSLESVEKNIKEKGHLHTMLSAKTIEENGFTVADMTTRMLKTIEELTLHTINQEKLIKIQKNGLEYQNNLIENLSKRLETLEENLKK